MKNIDELINELNKNTNYEEILIEIINSKENNHIKEIFEKIFLNNDLTKKQKEKIYNSILDYSNEISKNFKNKIEDIHKRGFKEGSLISLLIDRQTRDNFGKRDAELELLIEDFILDRLKTRNILVDNKEYEDKENEIKKIKEECTTGTLEISEGIDKLEDLYEFREDLEEIEAYKIGFKDALKFVLHKADKE